LATGSPPSNLSSPSRHVEHVARGFGQDDAVVRGDDAHEMPDDGDRRFVEVALAGRFASHAALEPARPSLVAQRVPARDGAGPSDVSK
jgi:hypothetical protein